MTATLAPAAPAIPVNPFAGRFDPLMACDAYKLGHVLMYPARTTGVLANVTPRGSRIPGVNAFVAFGMQAFIDHLTDLWQPFFDADVDEVCAWYEYRVAQTVGPNPVGSDHIRRLHAVGYLPLLFCALPEGTETPVRVPMATIEATVRHAYWLVNYIETYMASETWLPIVSATTALHFRRMLDGWAAKTSDSPAFVDWQGHDFSARGMQNMLSAAASGAAHLLSFAGSDSLMARDWIEQHYPVEPGEVILGSVPATEHAVMCAGTAVAGELDTFRRLIVELFPTGILSIVSDTFDLWRVCTEYVTEMRDEIVARDGKVVIRPDSGDPADILCGDPTAVPGSPAARGVVGLLWDVFGGTVNSKGYRELDPHIGAIYGDSITFDRADTICARLAAAGFASTNVVFGIGSFTYTYVTRDTAGLANKTTWVEVDGVGHDVFKDPVTDSGLKRSAVGRTAVTVGADGMPERIDRATPEQEAASLLRPVWRDGKFLHRTTWGEVVARVGARLIR